ncbi:hypothetical protein EOPP23_06110 [Endozoicomonas sp. OPT23]|uniref:hypothetical protein n=1 Tax=Endozoicomonas sp. OPT23 TaxID=2072845 RepID=UPI00129ACD98|nr:hypothetical protein [Endozoicomonas sp. OPT23]MRI32559.1 hypothetical protein [Endozoicomonas sp. OPT23]
MLLRNLTLLFLFALQASHAYGRLDTQCINDAGVFADCDSQTIDVDPGPVIENRDFDIKLKRVYDLEFGQWADDGQTAVRWRTSRGPLCLLSFNERSLPSRPQVDRVLEASVVSLGSADGVFLVPADEGSTGPAIPVSITMERTTTDEVIDFSNRESDVLPGRGTTCAGSSFYIYASLLRSDILRLAKAENYRGTFTLRGQRREAPHLAVEVPFVVSISFQPRIQISGLEDVTLEVQAGQNVKSDQNFCVYTIGADRFGIKANSANGDGEFLLGSSGTTIPYQVSVGRAGNGQGQGNRRSLTEGADSVSQNSWRVSDSQLCASGQENMNIDISVLAEDIAGKAAGSYQDVLELIVEPS